MDQLIQTTFRGLHDAVNAMLDLVDSDIKMAVASRPLHIEEAGNQVDREVETRKRELMAEVRELKGMHEEMLARVAEM
jgi:tellurite resistance protein